MKRYCILIIFLISISIFSESTYSQKFNQLTIDENLAAKYLSSLPGTERRLNAFGNFRYNLLLTCDENFTRIINSQFKENWIKNEINNESYWLFSVLDAKTGTVDLLKIDYQKYTPVSFLNNDTLVLKLNDENKYIGCCYSDFTQFSLDKAKERLLTSIPSNYNNSFRFKVNTSFDKMILLKEDKLESLNIYIFQEDSLIVKVIESDVFFRDWKFLDFFWVDDEHILFFLSQPIERGINYCQKIYNIQNDKIIDLIIPDKDYQMDDYYNGFCLVRTGKEPPAYIYKLDLINDSIALSIDSMIEVEQEIGEPLYELGFVTESTIARITNIEGEKGFFSLILNLRRNNYLQIKISEPH
jgi:hypothetical protein